jgi:hypothetical protein
MTVTVLLAGLIPAVSAAPAIASEPALSEQPTMVEAVHAAVRYHQPVEALDQRTTTDRVLANPDGTVTVEKYAVPVRAHRSDGSWAPIDLTLRVEEDGKIRPAVSPVLTTLSGGADSTVGSVTSNGETVSLAWHNQLPKPALRGDTATYSEVLPGVDLRVTATRSGFTQLLVVKNRQAALDPRLASVGFTTRTSAPLQRDPSTETAATMEPPGKPTFHVDAPMMWDSSTKRAPLNLEVTEDAIHVVPDAGALHADDWKYPIFIDPSVSVGGQWAMINKTFPNQSYWSYDREDHAKVGQVYDTYLGITVMYRSIFQFGTDRWRGTRILGASFSANLLYSYNCTNSVTQLHQTGGVNSGTTWNNHSGTWGGLLTSVSNQSCNGAAKYSEWGGDALRNVIQATANSGTVTLGLRAENESNNSGWKKFDENTARLTVTYNTTPNAPDQLSAEGKGCATGDARPVVGTATPC